MDILGVGGEGVGLGVGELFRFVRDVVRVTRGS